METKSLPPCPSTATVRRNPHRRARIATPSSNLPLSPNNAQIASFPIDDILSIKIAETPNPQPPPPPPPSPVPASSENLKVFLRIRPLTIQSNTKNRAAIAETKNAWPKNPKAKNVKLGKPKAHEQRSRKEVCVTVNDSHSITLSPPQILQDTKRIKSEVYEGFEHVFSSESSQNEVYDKTVKQLVEDFLRGKSGMLAAIGPSGSGKTHTVFGSVREPGMVPLALRQIFSSDEGEGTKSSRMFYLSMFEISSEKGKAEKLHDLLQEGSDLSMQKSAIKGLQEVLVHDTQHAEVLIESGLLKRATATTNSNSQSSRSQCIINMRCELKIDGEVKDSILTIVDLAGAERERKTKNQGTRLLQSNFINNTSMVFGLCLRSLLEHQKNPRRPLQKHFQSSMLTKYLRDYLEGKKRMTLVLTVRPGEEDYNDTSFLLRQASPYMQIKFNSIEEPANLNCSKRPSQTLHRPKHLKRRKCTGLEACGINGEKIVGDYQLKQEDVVGESVKDGDLIEVLIQSEECLSLKEKSPVSLDRPINEFGGREREQKIMLGFSKAIWKVLKEYNEKLKVAENEICSLKYDLANERKRSSDLENAMENLKSECSCRIDPLEFKVKILSDMKGHQSKKLQEASLEATASSVQGSSRMENGHRVDPTERSADVVVAPDAEIVISGGCCHQNVDQQPRNLSQASQDMREEVIYSKSEASRTSTHSCLSPYRGCERAAESSSNENAEDIKHKGEEDIYVGDEETGCSSVLGTFSHQRSEDTGNSEDLINLTAVSRDYIHYEDKMISGDVTNQTELERECSQLSSKLADITLSYSDTPNIVRENCALSAGELESSSSEIPECIVSSSPSPRINRDNISFPDKDKLEVEGGEDSLVLLVNVVPTEDPACVPERDDSNTVVAHRVPPRKESQDMAKPKRRLLPASSLLLKDLNSLVIADEIDKPKGAKGEKKLALDGRSRNQSNTSLLHLLKRNTVH